MKEITITEYSKIAGITPEAISYRIKNKKLLPGILSFKYDKKERRYILKYDGSKIKGLFRSHNPLRKN